MVAEDDPTLHHDGAKSPLTPLWERGGPEATVYNALMSRAATYLPTLLLLLFSGWCGTFDGAARGGWTIASHLALLAVVVAAGPSWRDPLRLARGGNLLLVLFALSAALAFYQSPVPRAGRVALVLLPAFALVPAFVEQCWADRDRRRHGLLALTATVGAIAAWSLAGWWWLDTPGASLPLGHHNLLAAWLVTLLPLALLPWRDGAAARLLAAAAGLLALAALAATRSMSGLLALGAVAFVAAWQLRRFRWLVTLAGLGAAFAGRSRILAVAAGEDISTLARRGYMEAAWRGFLERPLLGWGPGSANWTLSRFLVPRPGVHPPDEVVADPHSWPLRLAFENGALGLLLFLAAVAAFAHARWHEKPADPALRRAAFLGLLGFMVIGLAGRPFAAPALPLAAMLVVGALLAAGPARPRPAGRRGFILAAAITLLLLPADLAHLAYDRALWTEDPQEQTEQIRRAVRLDPSFPVYRLRLALLERDAEEAVTAAEEASGAAHYWLLAGLLGNDPEALIRSCELNPLGALAPFRLALGAGDDPRAATWTARALLAEPLLMAAADWRKPLPAAAGAEIVRLDGVERGWLEELAGTLERVRGAAGRTRRLVLEMDGEGATGLSLHAFRRLPWPAYLDEVSVFADPLPEIGMPAATRLRTTAADVFMEPDCGLRIKTQEDD